MYFWSVSSYLSDWIVLSTTLYFGVISLASNFGNFNLQTAYIIREMMSITNHPENTTNNDIGIDLEDANYHISCPSMDPSYQQNGAWFCVENVGYLSQAAENTHYYNSCQAYNAQYVVYTEIKGRIVTIVGSRVVVNHSSLQ